VYSHNGHHSNTIRKQLTTTIIIPSPLCTHYLCSWLIPCSSVSPQVSVAPPTLQTEVEESGRPPSSNVNTPHSEDWEHHLLWWGYTGKRDTSRLVFQYNPKQDTWSQLPICPTLQFGLTQLDGKLVTVGGRRLNQPTTRISDVYIFQESETWENSIIPPMPTARSHTTAVNYKSTIVVSGGLTHWHTDSELRTYTTTVEVFQTKTYQWHHAEPLPVGHGNMSCVIVNDDTCYLTGGTESDGYASTQAYCTSVSNLISRALPPDHPETSSSPQASPSPPTWQVLPECPLHYSTAAELGGCLLAIAGEDDSQSPSSAVHMYSPSTNSWVRISSGDLPVPRFLAAATQLEGGDIIFVGGDIKQNSPTKTVFIVSTEQ